jgi:hypothetical protein
VTDAALDGNQLADMIGVVRGRVDQCVSTSAQRKREVARIVAIEHGDPGATFDKLSRWWMKTTMGDRDIPTGDKKLLCNRPTNLPGAAENECAVWRRCLLYRAVKPYGGRSVRDETTLYPTGNFVSHECHRPRCLTSTDSFLVPIRPNLH